MSSPRPESEFVGPFAFCPGFAKKWVDELSMELL